jgi:hypothetical protein
MKKIFLSIVLMTFLQVINAQVGINADNSVPDPSAMLDVKSTNRGLLLPRVTFEQRNAIENPAEGLIVFCIDCSLSGTGAISLFEGGVWKTLEPTCYPPQTPIAAYHTPSSDQITWAWLSVPVSLGYKWSTNPDFFSAIDLGTNTTFTETGLECWTEYTRYIWAYNACGHSPELIITQTTLPVPLANSPEADTHSITSDQIIWNWHSVNGAIGYKWSAENDFETATDMGSALSKTETGLTCNTGYTRYVWAYDSCGSSAATTLTDTTNLSPDAPSEGTHAPSTIQIIWNWNPVSGASGYKWNTVDDYSTATNMGTTATKTESGLICDSVYTRFVWAYNTCGISASVSLTQSTSECCPTNITINHTAGAVAPVSKSVPYGIVTGITGEPAKCWITRNLGASQQATSVSDNTEASAGWYWQFNIKQGYQYTTSRTPNTTWINIISEDSDWQAANDPCALELGASWRLPTFIEWYNVNIMSGWTTWNGPWVSGLKMHAAGYLLFSNGSLSFRGSNGFYWSSKQQNPDEGRSMDFGSTYCNLNMHYKTYGFSVRCLRD